MAKEKPDTRFRACKAGCKATVWCVKATICPDCRAHAAELGRRRKRMGKVPQKTPPSLGSAYLRGLSLVRNLSSFGRRA